MFETATKVGSGQRHQPEQTLWRRPPCSTISTLRSRKVRSSCCSARQAAARRRSCRIIAGLEMPDTGRILLHGKDVTELPARERGTGVIFQSYALFPENDRRAKYRLWSKIAGSASERIFEKRSMN